MEVFLQSQRRLVCGFRIGAVLRNWPLSFTEPIVSVRQQPPVLGISREILGQPTELLGSLPIPIDRFVGLLEQSMNVPQPEMRTRHFCTKLFALGFLLGELAPQFLRTWYQPVPNALHFRHVGRNARNVASGGGKHCVYCSLGELQV